MRKYFSLENTQKLKCFRWDNCNERDSTLSLRILSVIETQIAENSNGKESNLIAKQRLIRKHRSSKNYSVSLSEGN